MRLFEKREFDNSTVVSYLELKALFTLLKLNPQNKSAIKSYQQQLKATVIWFSSMGCHLPIQSTESVIKVVKRLPNYLLLQFYQKDIQADDTKVDLLVFSNWLDEKIKDFYNPSHLS